MKKILLLLLLTTGFLQAQTFPVNPTPFGKITLNTNIESTTATKISVQEDNKQINWIQPINIPITTTPNNYTPTASTIGGHLSGINTAFGNIYNTRVKVEYPDLFTFRPFNIYEKNSRYYTDFKVSSLVSDKISKMLPYYVNFASGNNANDGKTPATAFKTISYAYGIGARLIYLSKGVHLSSWGDLNTSFTNTDDFFVIGASDGVSIVTNAPAVFPTFTLVSGTAYSAVVTSNTLAVDLKYTDSYGFPLKLKEVFTQADCIAELGTFYKNVSTITINLKDGRVPDSNVLIPASTANANYSANAGYNYVKDITFIGGGLTSGSHGSDSQDGSNSTMVALSDNCKFLYAQSSNYIGNGGEGSRVRYNKLTMFENCVSYGNSRDGFNYVGDYANPMNIVEINCQAFNNGLRGTSNSVNGSSAHQGAFPLRLNCKYYNNYGPNVADQGGGITYNVGCESFNSAVPSIDTANIDFNIQPLVGSTSYMFNRGCQAYGSVYSFRISGTTPAYMVNVGNHYGGLVSTNTPGAPQTITFADSFTSADVPAYVYPALSAYTAHGEYAPLASPTFTGTVTTPAIVVSGETASTIASFDASKVLKSLPLATYPSLTELSYGKGVTSAIQTQLNAKALNLLTGYVSGAGTVASTDTVLQAIQKLNGNDALLNSRPYKTYLVSITQPGTSMPGVITTFENQLSGAIVWSRAGVGSYQGTLTGAFPANKVSFHWSNNAVNSVTPISVILSRLDSNTINMVSNSGITPTDGIINLMTLEIRVYN